MSSVGVNGIDSQNLYREIIRGLNVVRWKCIHFKDLRLRDHLEM